MSGEEYTNNKRIQLLKETREAQREVVCDLLNFLKDDPADKKQYEKYIQTSFKKFFKLEMDYYGYKCDKRRKKDNDIILEFVNKKKSSWRALFSTPIYAETPNEKDVPIISINTARERYNLLFSPDQKERIKAGRLLLEALLHESRHFRQINDLYESRSSAFGLRDAKERVLNLSCPAIYKVNHNRFAFEADAEFHAYLASKDIGISEPNWDKQIDSYSSDKATSYFLIPFGNLVDRNTYIETYSDQIMYYHPKGELYLKYYPILLKEYEEDGYPKRLNQLIIQFKSEVCEVLEQDIDQEDKELLIDEISSMYFDLFTKKLLLDNRFELYEAIKVHGSEFIKELLLDIKYYNDSEKQRKTMLVDIKHVSLSELKSDKSFIIVSNKGFMVDTRTKDNEVVEIDDYIKSLNLHVSEEIDNFLSSSDFQDFLPILGYFELHDGSLLSVEDFIKNILIPKLKEEDPKQFYGCFLASVAKIAIPYYEQDHRVNINYINKHYEDVENHLNMVFASGILNEENISAIDKKYSEDDLCNMEFVARLGANDFAAFNYFYAPLTSTENGITYTDYLDEQIDIFYELERLADNLTKNSLFNSNGFNYVEFFKNDPRLSAIKRSMEVCENLKGRNGSQILGVKKEGDN